MNTRKRIKINNLWSHQKKAINICEDYITDAKNNFESALIKLPTGTGKSGIIAYLSRLSRVINCVLILTPRKKLRDQLASNINHDFFKTVHWDIKSSYRSILKVNVSSVLKETQEDSAGYIMTFQMFTYIKKNMKQLYQKIVSKIDIILIDEGHYEPAFSWSEAVRETGKKSILFTATPYRNDLKYFHINQKYVLYESFAKMVNNGIIRNVVFKELKCNHGQMDAFVEETIRIYNIYKKKYNTNDKKIKIIIKCEQQMTIEELVEKFNYKNQKVIGIHENFSDTDHKVKNVPQSINKSDIVFWIHQNKLLEGVDDKQFQILMIYDSIFNARALVQQIGRIVRIHQDDTEKKCYIYHFKNDKCNQEWLNFIQYEQTFNHSNFSYLVEQALYFEMMNVVKDKAVYMNKQFRRVLKVDSIKPNVDIMFEKKFYVFNKSDTFEYEDILKDMKYYFSAEGYITYDFVINIVKNKDLESILNCNCFLLIKIKNSDSLVNHFHIEWHMTSFIIVETPKYVYMSAQVDLNNFFKKKESFSLSKIDARTLLNIVYADFEKTQIKRVALTNTNLGLNTVTNKTIDAKSIEDTLPNFDDYGQICTRAIGSGFNGSSNERYYMGFNTGRVSSQNTSKVNADEYLKWIEKIDSRLIHDSKKIKIIDRFATQAKVPENKNVIYALIDVNEIYNEGYQFYDDNNRKVGICEEVTKVSSNVLNIKIYNKKDSEHIKIKFIKDVFSFDSHDNPKIYLMKNNNIKSKISLAMFLKKYQNIRLLMEEKNLIYYKEKFYDPNFKIGKGFNHQTHQLSNCMYPIQSFNFDKEKNWDNPYTDSDLIWHQQSLFGYISKSMIDKMDNVVFNEAQYPSFMICDDLNSEIADFILLYDHEETPKIILIHAKTSSKKNKVLCTAAGIQDVCGQAMKNLKYISMFNESMPKNYKHWTGKWNQTQINRKIIGEDKSANEILEIYKNIVKNPKTNREIWIMTTNTISLKYVNQQLLSHKPMPWVLQTIYLLNSVMHAASSVGATLKVFCNT